MKLYNYLSENTQAETQIETPAYVPELVTEFTHDAVKIRFKPEALSKYSNLLVLLYKLGYIYQRDKTFSPGAKINRLIYIQLNYGKPDKEEQFRVCLSETRQDGKLITAGITIEDIGGDSSIYIRRCLLLTELDINMIELCPEEDEYNKQIDELFSIEDDGQGFPEINEAVRQLKHNKVWRKHKRMEPCKDSG